MEKIKKVVIIGGHPTPAIALIDNLEKEKNIEIYFFGRKKSTEGDSAQSLEYKLLSNRKSIKFYSVTTGRLQRRFTKYTIPSLLKIPFGFLQSLFYLIKIKPNLVVGFGGYLSVPVIISSYILRIPIFVHQQTSIPGLSTQITGKLAKKIFISFRSSSKFFDYQKVIFSGNLLRDEIIKPSDLNNSELKKFLELQGPLLYVTGGGQGSKLINDFMVNNFDEIIKTPYRFIIQTGSLNNAKSYSDLKFKKSLQDNLKQKIFIIEHLRTSEVGAILNKKPIIFGRSGANTITEIVYHQIPSILVPLDIAAGSEQLQNAQLLTDKNLAKIIKAKDLNFTSFSNSLIALLKSFDSKSFTQLNEEIKIDLENKLAKQVKSISDIK